MHHQVIRSGNMNQSSLCFFQKNLVLYLYFIHYWFPMQNKNVAVFDLGSNSFHLLIARFEEGNFIELLKTKDFVRISEGGIHTISPAKYQLGLATIGRFTEILKEYNVKTVKAYGTACFREADNAPLFLAEIKEKFNLDVEVIDGEREAELIYKGVQQCVELNSRPRLIVDIGGGSTEFILANSKEIFWKHSFNIGASVLKNKFHHQEPISVSEYSLLINALDEELKPLWEQIEYHKPVSIVGCSGAFKSLVNLQRNHNAVFPVFENNSELVNLSEFKVIHLTMLKSNLEERLAIEELEPQRAPLMTVATSLISIILSHMPICRSLVVSQFSMKEGMLIELQEELSL